MNSTTALLVNIPILALLYILVYFTQFLSGKRQFYGVSLNSDYFEKEEFKKLDKKFKLLLTIGFIIFILIDLICIYIYKAYVFASTGPVLGFCIYQFAIFVYIHNKVKLLKSEIYATSPNVDIEKTKVVFDTEFINSKNKIVKKYSILFTIPLVLVILTGIYTLSKYNSMPDIIPIHWGINGVADGFATKSFATILGITLTMVGLGVIIYISSVGSLKSRIKLSTNNVDESKKENLYYLNRLAITFAILNLATQAIFIVILFATARASNINIVLVLSLTGLLILASVYLTYLYYKCPFKSHSASYSVDDNDNLWILGSFYNNPNDPSLFVQKRFGVGWTINIGTTKGKIILLLPLIIIALTLIFLY